MVLQLTSACPCAIQIQLANSTAYRAAQQISDSLDKLGLVSSLREEVESDLGNDFQSLYRNNSLRLEEIRRINELLQELVSQAERFGEQANVNLTMAMDTATRAKNEAGQRRREAQIARHNATNAHSDAMQANSEAENALDIAMEFKVRLYQFRGTDVVEGNRRKPRVSDSYEPIRKKREQSVSPKVVTPSLRDIYA